MSRNEDIQDKVGVTLMKDKMRLTGLGWFWHVMKRCTYAREKKKEKYNLFETA